MSASTGTPSPGSFDELTHAKMRILRAESKLAKARNEVTSAEVELKLAEMHLANLLAPKEAKP